ncbi:MAG TPA: hypothetical protein VFB21_15640 [Chthonomonadaceae bacterium]|nr:hypothetical protein [Chthonomonadaceae bacterium]
MRFEFSKEWLRLGLMASLLIAGIGTKGQERDAPSPAEREALRQRALSVLQAALHGDPIQGMHAAEALVWNGYSQEVRPLYEAAQSSADPKTRVAAWRVLAQITESSRAEREKYVLKVRDFALDTHGLHAEFALESLAKLGYAGRDKPFVEQARSGEPVMRILARWVLANSGRPQDETYLAELLDLPDARMRAVTAYALRFLKKLQPTTLAHLRKRLEQEPEDAPDRFFYIITLYLHGPAAERQARKAELFRYAEKGNEEGKYQALLMLGRWADASDLPRIAPYLEAGEADTRIGAANSLLTILRSAPRNR